MTSVWFCKKTVVFSSVSVFLVQFFVLCVLFNVYAIFYLCLCDVTLKMMYFGAELVQLIVTQSDSELEVQRYSMNKKFYDC